MSYTVKDILRLEVAPALGCTEPVAVSLAAAAASSLLSGPVESVRVDVDPNVYKNGMAVAIPGTEGLCGLDTAAALGAVAGDPARRLEVLVDVQPGHVREAQALIEAGKVEVGLLEETRGLTIQCSVTSGDSVAESRIENVHDNIVSLSLDGTRVDSELVSESGPEGASGLAGLEDWLKTLSLAELVELAGTIDDEDKAFLLEGVEVNMRLADTGLKHGHGLGIGKSLDRLARQKLISRDMVHSARMLASAASDARMAGVDLPAMSSAGSGNHGLTATLPIRAVRDHVSADENAYLEALALSHIVTGAVKAHTGRLSAVCGCSVAAGAGAAAGVAHLLGGDTTHIAGAVSNLIEDLAGVICDGAKAACSLKLATAAGSAVQAALMSLQGVRVHHTDGIVGQSPEQTMKNIGQLSTQGMIETDRTILQIMIDKRFTPEEC